MEERYETTVLYYESYQLRFLLKALRSLKLTNERMCFKTLSPMSPSPPSLTKFIFFTANGKVID